VSLLTSNHFYMGYRAAAAAPLGVAPKICQSGPIAASGRLNSRCPLSRPDRLGNPRARPPLTSGAGRADTNCDRLLKISLAPWLGVPKSESNLRQVGTPRDLARMLDPERGLVQRDILMSRTLSFLAV
jgi:hypothetical protein